MSSKGEPCGIIAMHTIYFQIFKRWLEQLNSLGMNMLLHFSSSMLLTTVIVCLRTYPTPERVKKLKQQTMVA
jgi:hypothetical protein